MVTNEIEGKVFDLKKYLDGKFNQLDWFTNLIVNLYFIVLEQTNEQVLIPVYLKMHFFQSEGSLTSKKIKAPSST